MISIIVFPAIVVEELSKCERQRKVGEKANENVAKKEDKVFVPSCESDGSFSSVQCDESNGLCWCVSSDGEEIKDTRVKGKPKCPLGESKENRNVLWVSRSLSALFVSMKS